MDDTTQNDTPTITILGQDYPASPLGPEQLVAIPLIKQVATSTAIKLIFKLFLVSLGQEAHDDVTLALAGGDIDFAGLLKIVSDLADVTAKAQNAAPADAGA